MGRIVQRSKKKRVHTEATENHGDTRRLSPWFPVFSVWTLASLRVTPLPHSVGHKTQDTSHDAR